MRPTVATRASLFAASIGLALSGGAHAFPPELEVASLLPSNGGNGSAGIVLNGAQPHDMSGLRVDGAGDVNGDGLDDVIVSGYGTLEQRGVGYIVLGRSAAAPVLPLSAIAQAGGNLGVALTGPDNGYLGTDVSTAGDVNGDGIDDFIIGSERAQPGGRQNAGVAYVVFGRAEAQGGLPAQMNLGGLNPGQGG